MARLRGSVTHKINSLESQVTLLRSALEEIFQSPDEDHRYIAKEALENYLEN